jgi:hypothetical protein
MTDYENLYEDIVNRSGGSHFRLLTLLPGNSDSLSELNDLEFNDSDDEENKKYVEEKIFNLNDIDHEVRKIEDKPKEMKQGPRPTDLELQMSIYPIKDCPEYEALSYRWGNPESERYSLKCNGHEFVALQSLKNALYALRLPDRPRTLWIDAICINQNTDDRAREECGLQVQLMQHIYRSASRVVVWLGKEHEQNFAPAFEDLQLSGDLFMGSLDGFVTSLERAIALHLDVLATEPRKLWQNHVEVQLRWTSREDLIRQAALRIRDSWNSRTEGDPRDHDIKTAVDELVNDGTPKVLRKAAKYLATRPVFRERVVGGIASVGTWRQPLRNILCREWWTRAWIIQEVCLAQEVIFLCGDKTFGLDLLFLGLVLFSSFNVDPLFRGYIMASWSLPQIVEYRSLYQQKDNASLPSFLHLLNEFRTADATNPYDHVYGLLGLVAPDELSALGKEDLVPDYTTSNTTSRCYIKTARAIYTTSSRLDILSLSQSPIREVSKSTTGPLPSWAPDWNVKLINMLSPKHGVESIGGKNPQSLFSACGPCQTWKREFRGDEVLVISGYAVDTITDVVDETLPTMSESFLDFLQGEGVPDEMDEDFTVTDMLVDMMARLGSILGVLFKWEQFVSSKTGPYPTGEDIGRVSCAVRCYGNTPEGLDAAYHDFNEYLKALRWGRRVYNLAVSPSRPSLPFRKSNSEEEKSQPSKLRQSLMFVGGPSKKDKARMVKFNSLQGCSLGRKLAWTEKGYLALVPQDSQAGDKIVLCKGSRLPLLMRATREPNQWRVLEGCYVHGIMHGEAWNESLCTEMELI